MSEYIILLTATITGAIGIIQLLIERRSVRIRDIKLNHLKDLKFKLHKFYFPIMFLLKRDEHLFESTRKLPATENNLGVLNELRLANHSKVMDIIESHIADVNPVKSVRDDIISYDRHTAVYRLLSSLGISDISTNEFNAEYPTSLLRSIELRLEQLCREIKCTEESLAHCIPKMRISCGTPNNV